MVIEEFTIYFYLSVPIDDVTWHARVGIFYTLKSLPKIKLNAKMFPVLTNPVSFSPLKMVKTNMFLSLCISNLLIQCGDIEIIPSPIYSSLTFCHWNLNGLAAHDKIEISWFQAYVTQYNCDIINLHI